MKRCLTLTLLFTAAVLGCTTQSETGPGPAALQTEDDTEPMPYAWVRPPANAETSRRLDMLRFMRELEAARLLIQAETAWRAGDVHMAYDLADRAHNADPGNDAAWAMRQVLSELGGRAP